MSVEALKSAVAEHGIDEVDDGLVIQAARSIFGPGLYCGGASALGLLLLDVEWHKAVVVFVILFALATARLFRRAISIIATILLVWGGLHAASGVPTPSQLSRALSMQVCVR